jgi:asparagine synthase (glutamine-hydrolysing)
MTPLAGVFRFDSSPSDAFCQWDGRLDDPAVPDPAALADHAFNRLIGDWSLVRWQPGARALVLASDYAGTRPLYYRIEGHAVRWSSSLQELVDSGETPELDDRYFAALLAPRMPRGLTPYRGIETVPAGCAVRIDPNGVRVERFWDATVAPDSLGDYEARLLDLFRVAVESRVRGHARVCCELSGGLDSSSVACMALRVHPNVTTFSYTHPGATDAPYIRAVEQQFGITGEHLDVRDYPFVTPERTGGAAPGWWEPRFLGLAARMESLGATAFLTGQIGDLTMANMFDDSEQVAAPLRQWRLGDAAREAFAWSQSLRVPIYPILWRAARMAASAWAPADDLSPTAWQKVSRENSLGPRLRDIEETPIPGALDWRAAPPDRRRRVQGLAGWLESRRLQPPEALQHVAYSHPFADRRLVEFMLAIPPGAVVRPGEPRRLMRRAFAGFLPEPVLLRKTKASFGGFYDQCLTPLAQEMLRDPARLRSVELGYLDRASLIERLNRYLAGTDSNADQLRIAILVEFWLRTARYR